MSGMHDFGDAESLALDREEPDFADERSAARDAWRQSLPHQDFKMEERPAHPLQGGKPKRDIRRVAVLALIAWLVLTLLGLLLWQKFLSPQPIVEPLAAAAAPVSRPAMPAPRQNAAKIGAASAAAGRAAPPMLATRTNASAPFAAQQSATAPDAPASAPSGRKSAAPALDPRAINQKSAPPEETLAAKVARLEAEVKALTARSRPESAHKPVAAGHGRKARDLSVLGMSSTSVWVTQPDGRATELQVGDRFRNGEVIQRIDQQAQVIETDHGRYKVNL